MLDQCYNSHALTAILEMDTLVIRLKAGAERLIADGMRVEVDGTAGTVRTLEASDGR